EGINVGSNAQPMPLEPSSNVAQDRRWFWFARVDGNAGQRKRGLRTKFESARPTTTPFPRSREASDLSFHARRPIASRYLRPQAAADSRQRQTGSQAVPRPAAKSARFAMEILEIRAIRNRGQRSLSACGRVRRSALRHSFDGDRRRQSSGRLFADE